MAMLMDVDVLVCVVVTLAMATVFMLLRMLARRMTRVALWWDDALAAFAYAFALAWAAIVLYWAGHAGLGHRLEDIPIGVDEALKQSKFSLYLAEIFYAFSLAFSKMSILCFYWRLFRTSNIRLPIQILMGCSIVWLIIRTFMAIFHCVPVQAFWDSTVEGAVCNIDDSKFFFGTVLVHLIIDLVILALPVVEVKHLQLRIGQKVAVIALFMFGILVCIASVVVLVESNKFNPNSEEMPLEITPIIVWATVEVNFAIVSACLPMTRPVFRRMLPGSILASNPSSYPLSGGVHSKGIKMATMTRTNEEDDTSSTRQLADMENRLSGSVEFERGGGTPSGPRTVISSRANNHDDASDQDETHRQGRGIHVKNDLSISYEQV